MKNIQRWISRTENWWAFDKEYENPLLLQKDKVYGDEDKSDGEVSDEGIVSENYDIEDGAETAANITNMVNSGWN